MIDKKELESVDVKDKFLVIKSDELDASSIQAIQDQIRSKGCLGTIGVSADSDVESVDVKDRVLVIKSDELELDADSFKAIREQMFKKGCLGVLCFPKDTEVESLGLAQLEAIVANIKARTSRKDANDTQKTDEG